MTAIAQSAAAVVLALPEPRATSTRTRPSGVVDISRRAMPWRWTSVLLAPIELLAVAWSIPLVIVLLMVPIGLAVTAALWIARYVFRL